MVSFTFVESESVHTIVLQAQVPQLNDGKQTTWRYFIKRADLLLKVRQMY